MTTHNSLDLYPVDNENFTHADFQINVNTHSETGIVAGMSLYLTEDEARRLMAKLIAYLGE